MLKLLCQQTHKDMYAYVYIAMRTNVCVVATYVE